MPRRFRRAFALRPVTSRKNIVQDVAIIAAAAKPGFTIAKAVDNPVLANTDEVQTGCRLNTVYIECWIYGNGVAGVNTPIVWNIHKNPNNALTMPNPSSAGADANKRWIFAMGKGLVGNQANGQPGYVIRGWFSIPKKMRRMGANDYIKLQIENNTANDLNVCRLAVYKWYI